MSGGFCSNLEKIEKYFIDVPAACPYGLPYNAVYHQSILGPLPDSLMTELLASGYRRSGNSIYAMRCGCCQACVPIRLRPENFSPDRNQRRVWRRNQDVSVEIAPLNPSPQHIDLCDRFLRARYPKGENSGRDYYTGFFCNSVISTAEVRYRVGDRLVGIGIVDLGAQFLSAVYFYYDPDCTERSPGTFNILSLIELCRQHHIEQLYLGYWIEEVPAMAYKFRFRPHELLIDGQWRPVG